MRKVEKICERTQRRRASNVALAMGISHNYSARLHGAFASWRGPPASSRASCLRAGQRRQRLEASCHTRRGSPPENGRRKTGKVRGVKGGKKRRGEGRSGQVGGAGRWLKRAAQQQWN
eukprot:4376732-Pleurochrysis_carterae.AAC.1